MADFVCGIQSPAIDSRVPNPACGYIQQIIANSRIAGLQLRHKMNTGPPNVCLLAGGNHYTELLNVVPILVTGSLILRADIFEREEFRAGVIENTIQDHPPSQLV